MQRNKKVIITQTVINSQKEIEYDKCGIGSYFSKHGQKRALWAAGPYTEK